MTYKQLQALKRQATKQLFLGIAMFIVATIPVVLFKGADHTGSVFCWLLAIIAVYDGINRLIKLNKKGQYYVHKK